MPTKPKKSISKFIVSKDNIIGGLKPKNNPDNVDKEEFEKEEEKDDEEEEYVEEKTEEDNESDDDSDDEENEAENEETENNNEDDEDNIDDDNNCIYKLTKLNKKNDNTLNIEIEDNFEDEIEEEINNKYVKPNERKTKPYLFEFERVRLIGDRARQLSMGAKPMIKNIEIMNPRAIANLELENKIIPLIILRELPNGLIEKWKVSELTFF